MQSSVIPRVKPVPPMRKDSMRKLPELMVVALFFVRGPGRRGGDSEHVSLLDAFHHTQARLITIQCTVTPSFLHVSPRTLQHI